MKRYVLIHWPESQNFMEHPDCYFCQCSNEDSFRNLDQTIFVPEEMYYEFIEKQNKFFLNSENTEYDYGHNIKHLSDD